jgi:hypothetical protein
MRGDKIKQITTKSILAKCEQNYQNGSWLLLETYYREMKSTFQVEKNRKDLNEKIM